TLELTIGENEILTATVDPESSTDKTVAWGSSDKNVATVSDDGVVTGVSVGETTITATCGEATVTCKVIVKPILATSITLNKETLELTIGENETLTATVDPESSTDKTIAWSSSDENVATVSGDGVVTAVSVGETTITATCGEATATCEITVSPCLVESIELDYSKWNGFPGESFTISATVNPDNATDKTIIWNSSDPEVATVDETGLVIAVKPGSALITAITSNGVTGTCEVTVLPILVESITLDPNIIQGIIGEVFVIKASVLPEDASNPKIYWESGNTNVAIVDQDGNVKINGEGSSRIFAYATDGSNVSGECFILGTSGIESILTECGYHISIYTPSGLLIKKDCTLEDLRNLVPGIYIFKSEKKTVSVMIH
ncbi:MAG: Ig-like domain-containing protein, partial [Muribaculaceae bacterium]|nr:Ig-like domain-containing protein [Muribaculaceae bacterium]